jgi:diphthine-ammonia ligase
LTSLAYLWQRDQGELLSEMIEAGMEAIIIKVAGIGLESAHLGKTLAQMQPTFLKLVGDYSMILYTKVEMGLQNGLYGSHICGEGGEYESLTVDCPLFKKRISM